MSAYPRLVYVLELAALCPDGQSVCMWPGVSTAVLHNETPSATLFFMAVSMCCDANEPSLPQTPPLIVLFDLPLILLIRSPTFKVKRFASTSKCAPSHVCVYVCEPGKMKQKWHKGNEIVHFFTPSVPPRYWPG